ncbi:MAG: 16S rRNA (cytosine(1402)-N(4))-methyltransferase RsmH [Patescibacteria group bacterium]|nr:MAG: 16S rRNA (cytosine(1402)-N(4))-methyltransferase RsmH [Patescibacteria group bacterium]
MYQHTPVLLTEVLSVLYPRPGDTVLDATLGGGGYTFALADKVGKKGKVLALDADEIAIENAKLKITENGVGNIFINHANFKDLVAICRQTFGEKVQLDCLVFDLGLSSAQLQDRDRGFSFQSAGPLDMAFGSLVPKGATERIVNRTPVPALAEIIRQYGEERFALRIARSIDKLRREEPIKDTARLVEAVAQAVPSKYKHGRIHFATRTFQALRMATNRELDNLEIALKSAWPIMAPGGRLAVVSFHSLEDRVVKNFFKQEAKDCLCSKETPDCRCGHKATLRIITKKPITASDEEIEQNPRARSAKLRAAMKL